MRIHFNESEIKMWLSANDTYSWANRPGESWPCSALSGHRLFAEFDVRNGDLIDLAIDGKTRDIDADEFSACCADHLNEYIPKEHPARFGCVDQFSVEKLVE